MLPVAKWPSAPCICCSGAFIFMAAGLNGKAQVLILKLLSLLANGEWYLKISYLDMEAYLRAISGVACKSEAICQF